MSNTFTPKEFRGLPVYKTPQDALKNIPYLTPDFTNQLDLKLEDKTEVFFFINVGDMVNILSGKIRKERPPHEF